MRAKDVVVAGVCGAILFISQIAFAFLPNIELVSVMIIAFTLVIEKKTLYSIYVFALCEGLYYGFGVWWFMYLYVWTILYFLVRLFRWNHSVLLWAFLSGGYGLSFGALCSIPYFFIGGIGGGVGYWISGIPFDLLHGAGNFVVALVVLKPLCWVLRQTIGQNGTDGKR
jgi:energy-coupling factor transport system substrate-specific component